MIFLTMFLFSFIVYSIYTNLIKNEDNQTKVTKNFKDNIAILNKLGYYNFNYNLAKTDFISDCVNYILFSRNPSFKELYNFNYEQIDILQTQLENLYSSFITLCNKKNKVIGEFTINELYLFIKNQEEYKKIEKINNYRLKRSIILSKFLNDKNIERLVEALTYEELYILTT